MFGRRPSGAPGRPMNPLPPLRSNRPAGSQAGQAAAPAAGAAPTRSYGSVLDAAGLPPDARALLQDLLDLPLVEPQAVRDFLVKSADRLAGLTTRERAGHALVRGGDVEQYVYDHGPQPVERACEWARQTAAGLSAAHDGHLVHRDLKPSNLLLTADRRVKVVDFGLARQLTSTLTKPRTLLGSIEFMAPEQSLDPTAVGPPADVYGLGATLFWVLTGKLPLPRQPNVAEAVRALATGAPYRLREFRPEAPAALERLVAR